MPDFSELIPELRDWNDGRGIDIEAWIGCSGNFQLAIGYSKVFWPRFVEFETYVLREGFSVESLHGFEGNPPNDRQSVESVMNHLHIADIQYYGCEDASPERLIYLGTVLREIHEVKLRWQFPHRQFEVLFLTPDTKDDLFGYQITFFQKPV